MKQTGFNMATELENQTTEILKNLKQHRSKNKVNPLTDYCKGKAGTVQQVVHLSDY
jgi:hypothetical protein